MSATTTKHRCYRCRIETTVDPSVLSDKLESLEGTLSENGDEVFFTSGYGAREIAQKHAQESSGQVYVNTISRKLKRRDLSVPVAYAVSRSPVYTLRSPDDLHEGVYRAYWRPLS